MAIRVSCGSCEATLKVDEKHAGRKVRCPRCQEIMTVPETRDIGPPADEEESAFFNEAPSPSAPPPVPRKPKVSADEAPSRPSAAESAPAPPAPRSTFRPSASRPRSSSPPPAPLPKSSPADDFDVPEEAASRPRAAEEDDFSSLTSDELSDGETMLEDTPRTPKKKKKKTGAKRARVAAPVTGWRQHAYWFLLLALIPLCLNSLMEGVPLEERVEETIEQNNINGDDVLAEDGDFNILQQVAMRAPDHRINGALLAADSWMHWVFAGVSTAIYFGVLMTLWPRSEATPTQLILTGLITGTIGIMMLLTFQFIAIWTMGFNVRGRSVIVLLFYIIKFIGFSYRCAIDPDTGFGLSFMGFTCGVGLCEELCKAVPIAIYLNNHPKATWRDACLIGLASGIGFGVSEGITYSGSYYNGVHGSWIYLVRFISCVALHSLWAGAIGVLMYHNQDYISEFSWENIGMFIVLYLGIGMILHGLYDTFLKNGMELGALITAGVSFGWFAYMVHRSREADTA